MDKEKFNKVKELYCEIDNSRKIISYIKKIKKGDIKIKICDIDYCMLIAVPEELKGSIIDLIDNHYKSKLKNLEQELEEI